MNNERLFMLKEVLEVLGQVGLGITRQGYCLARSKGSYCFPAYRIGEKGGFYTRDQVVNICKERAGYKNIEINDDDIMKLLQNKFE